MKNLDQNAIPKIRTMEGIEKLSLTPEEAFILSRVDGTSTFEDIAKILSFDVFKVWTALQRFVDEGWIEITNPPPSKGQKQPSSKKTVLDVLEDDHKEKAAHPIPSARRKEILLRHEQIGEQNYYEVLQIPLRSKDEAVKKAYFQSVKIFHPDRYFGKNIGHYKRKIEEIFNVIQEAYDVLSDPAQKKLYDLSLDERGREIRSAPAQEEVSTGASEKNSETDLESQARKYFDMGKREEDAQNFVKAANFYQMARKFSPMNEKYVKAAMRTRPYIEKKRSEDCFQRGMNALSEGDRKEAIRHLEEALELNPKKRECLRELTLIYVDEKGMLERALELGKRALAFYEDDATLAAAMGWIYLRKNHPEQARHYFKHSLKLDKNNAVALKGLERLL